MNCTEINKNLIFYIEGDLSSEKEKIVKKHLEKCDKCKYLYNEMEKTLGVIQKENTPEINPFFYTRVKAKMEDVQESSFRPVFRPVFMRILQTSVAVVLIAFGVFVGIQMGDNYLNNSMVSGSEQTISKYQEYSQQLFLDGLEVESIETSLLKKEE
ncbi:MAG: zf-HC2 domain-containing protein [Bacteroidales bacterium]|nr:zf-HC2 domain-containing protein [Bacteroidales bacterium]